MIQLDTNSTTRQLIRVMLYSIPFLLNYKIYLCPKLTFCKFNEDCISLPVSTISIKYTMKRHIMMDLIKLT